MVTGLLSLITSHYSDCDYQMVGAYTEISVAEQQHLTHRHLLSTLILPFYSGSTHSAFSC